MLCLTARGVSRGASAANAVTPVEYLLAYAVPVVGGMGIFASDRLATFIAEYDLFMIEVRWVAVTPDLTAGVI